MRSSRCPTTLCRGTGSVFRLKAEATGFHLFCAAATGPQFFFRGFRLQAEGHFPRLSHDAC